MIKIYNAFILLFLVLSVNIAMADISYNAVDQEHEFTFKINYENIHTGKWVDLGSIPLKTEGERTDTGGHNPCSGVNYMCTAGSVNIYNNEQAGYIFYLLRKTPVIFDNKGNRYEFTVAFPDRAPVVNLFEVNYSGGNFWNKTLALNHDFSTPDDPFFASQASGKSQGYCYHPDCSYAMESHMHTSSGNPHLYVKIPKGLTASSLSFEKMLVLELELNISNGRGGYIKAQTAKLYVSGTIEIPQRCYIKTDDNTFDFGKVSSSDMKGLVRNVTTSVKTTCYSAPAGVQQSLKITPIFGGGLSVNEITYYIDNDHALGIIFNINRSLDCNTQSDNNNTFNEEYIMRVVGSSSKENYTDNINFGLCKYGMPSIVGDKTVILKLTSRWVMS